MELLKDSELWVLIAFILAFGFLAWKTAPRLTGALDQRAAKIRSDIETAARLREEAQAALAEFQRKQRDALREADEIVAHARAEAERTAAAAERELEAALERRRIMAREKVALEEAKAVAEVRNSAIEIAVAAVRHALAEGLDQGRRAQLIDDAIAGLPSALQ